MSRLRTCLLAGLLALTSCASERAATSILLVIDSDLVLGAELPYVYTDVYNPAGEPRGSKLFQLPTEAPGGALPLSVVLDAGEGASRFRVVVRGGVMTPQGFETSVEREAMASFVEGEELRLDIVLERACWDVRCVDASSMPTEQTCVAGACVPVVEQPLPPRGPGPLGGYSRPAAGALHVDE